MLFRWLLIVIVPVSGCAAASAPSGATADAQTVEYPSAKEQVRSLLVRPAGSGPFPALVSVHEDYGLTDWMKQQAARLAAKGYVVLAVDLYRGEVVGNVLDAHIMDRGLPEDRVLADLKAAVDYLRARSDVQAERIGIIGWDSGGGYALDAAIRDRRLQTAVVCYGRLTTDPKLLEPLSASVLALFAEKDEGIAADTIEQFRKIMAGKRLNIHIYPSCRHGFMNPKAISNATMAEAEAASDAWHRIEAHLESQLKP